MSEIINLGNYFMNRYLLPIDGGYCLIDTGYKGDIKKFLLALKKKSIPLDSIKYLVLTHMHADHVGFAKELLDKTNAVLIYDTDDKSRLEAGKNNLKTYISDFISLISSKISISFVDKTQTFPAVYYDNYVDAKTQPLSKYGIEFLSLKGHTECDVALLYDGKLFCGDICMNNIMSTHHSPMWIHNKYNMIDSWSYILSHKDISTIYPAHGKPFPVSDLGKDIAFWKNKGVFPLLPPDKTRWI